MEVDARLRRDGTSKIGAIDYADRARRAWIFEDT
jgi:hypothetical protein